MKDREDEIITTSGSRASRWLLRRRSLIRLSATAAGFVLAAGLGAQGGAAQESEPFYTPIQDNVADLLTSRGVDYEFDGPDLAVIVLVPAEEEAAAPAPLPAPPVESTSIEPAPGSEGTPVEDPF